jgi:two-component system cell cycle sensor histidine kinase/response regulator CckA
VGQKGHEIMKEGDYIVLSVSDTGIGMSPEEQEKVFEPFYTKKVMGRSGTGLGMTVVWNTLKDHGGHIDIQSKKGEGTCFSLFFPATTRVQSKPADAISPEKFKGRGEKVLVVDDVEEQRDIASAILTKLGYSVSTASSGEEAVRMLDDNTADLLVLDMILDHGIDGLETYKRILRRHPQQKAVIVSGYSETDRVREAQRLGAGAYLKKPYSLEKIGLALRSELNSI